MQVHYDEGLAIHIGPEPCVGVREDDGEASVGEGIGQTLSPENLITGRGRDRRSNCSDAIFRTTETALQQS